MQPVLCSVSVLIYLISALMITLLHSKIFFYEPCPIRSYKVLCHFLYLFAKSNVQLINIALCSTLQLIPSSSLGNALFTSSFYNSCDCLISTIPHRMTLNFRRSFSAIRKKKRSIIEISVKWLYYTWFNSDCLSFPCERKIDAS